MAESTSQKAYTTGKVAEICMCSIKPIIKCCDKRLLESYNVPNSTHRRIHADKLYSFMKKNNIPTNNFPKEDIPEGGLEDCTKTKE